MGTSLLSPLVVLILGHWLAISEPEKRVAPGAGASGHSLLVIVGLVVAVALYRVYDLMTIRLN